MDRGESLMYLRPAPLAHTVASLRNGKTDLLEHVNSCCDRIEQLDPQVSAFVPESGRRRRLLAEAEELLQTYPDQACRPLLYGALVGVKDIIHVDGFPTRAGSELDPQLLAGPEAVAVKKLRQAGALVLGKTVTTEFAYTEPGPTRNPHNLEHTPGGSSSGSAAAVAAGFCQLSLGTQTIGSVIRPAAYCGVVGFKPSYDRVSTEGILYFSRSADHLGFFTQDLDGMALAAQVLLKTWKEIRTDYKPTLGVPLGRYLDLVEPECLELFYRQLGTLRDAGYAIKEIRILNRIADIEKWHRKMVAAEMAAEHRELFGASGNLYRPRTKELIRQGQAVTQKEYGESRKYQEVLKERLHTLMQDLKLDLWVTPPATGTAPAGLHSTGNPVMNLPWTAAGMPVINIPAGSAANGLPVGLQFIAPYMADGLLLHWASGIQSALQ